jgi:hypothetical protein
MGEFQGEQSKITAVEQKAGLVEKETGKKTHEELESELKAKHDVFFKQVDDTQKVFQEATKLKYNDAKAEFTKSKKEIKDLLLKVATSGETLLKDKGTDYSTIRMSADRISKVTEAIPKNLKFFQSLQNVDEFYGYGIASMDAAKKYQGKNDEQSKKFLKQEIDNAVANLGKFGASGELWNIEDAGIPPEFKWAYDFHKDRTEKAMDEAIEMKIKYANENEFDTDEKKSKMPYALRDLLKSFTEGTDGQGNKKEGYNAMKGHLSTAQSKLSLAKLIDDPEQKKAALEEAKAAYAKAKEAADGASFTMVLLDTWNEPGNTLPDDWQPVLMQVRRNIQEAKLEADREIPNIEKTLEGKVEKEGPATIEKANKDLNEAQTSITDALKIKNEILTDTKMSKETRKDKTDRMWGMARADFDKLTSIHRELAQVNKNDLSADYQKMLGEILTKSAKQIQELADIKLYCETKSFCEDDPLTSKYFVFKPDGTVEQTSDFLGLSVWKQEEILKKLHELPLKIQMEMEEKMAPPEAKNIIEGKKKLANGDWIGAKQDLLKYYNANANAEGHDEVKIAESKELLKQIAKLEIAQATARLLAMKESIQGRFEWRVIPGEKTDYGVHTKDQAYMYIEDMSVILAKAEQMIDEGKCLTIGDAELALRKMEGTLSTSKVHYQEQLAELKEKDPNDPELAKKKEESIKYWKGREESAQKTYDRVMRGEPDPFTGDLPTPETVEWAKKKLEEAKGAKTNLEKMTPEQYLQNQIIQTQADLNNEKFKSALVRFNNGFNGASDVFDVFKQQRLLNEPDKEKRDSNILQMAKTARDRGLTELAKQYYGMYFEKELGEKAKHVDRTEVMKEFIGDEDNRKHLDKQVDNWKESFKKKVGREPTEDEVDKIHTEIVRAAVDGAYSKAVKKALHADMQNMTGDRAAAWNDAYGGKVTLEDLGTGWFSDEEWNALPAKVAITTSIIIVSAATAGAAVELAGAGYCAMALLGEGALGRVAAFGANLAVESLVFVSTEGLLNGAINGDWSTYESGGSFLKAWGHNALTLGTLKGVGGGVGKLRGAVTKAAVGEAAYMPQNILKSAASDAGWWAARTTAESSALTAQAWALSKMEGKKFGSREAFKSFGENVVFSVSIGISHGIMGHGPGKGPEQKVTVESKEAAKEVKKGLSATDAAAEARVKADTAKKANSPDAAKLEAEAVKLETAAKEAEAKVKEKMKIAVEAEAKAAQDRADQLGSQIQKAREKGKEVSEQLLEAYQSAQYEALRLAAESKAANERPGNLFFSAFENGVSAEAQKAGIPKDAEAWVDKEGRIHFNIEHLNTGSTVVIGEGGKPVEAKIMAEGYKVKVNEAGEMRIVGPEGKEMSLKEYEKKMKGTPFERVLLNTMIVIKNHEATHQVLEHGFTKLEAGTDGVARRVPDAAKTEAFTGMFVKPGPNGEVPAGKIPLVDNKGQPMEPTWQNIQEYLCQVGDGTVMVSKAQAEAMQRAIQEQIPGFSFDKARQIATREIAKNPAEAFYREDMAAKHVGKPWVRIKSGDDFNAALKTEKGQESNYKIAHEILMGYIYVLRTGDPAQIASFKATHEAFVDPKVLDTFGANYQKTVDFVSSKLSTAEGLMELQRLERQGKITPSIREVIKRMSFESKQIKELTSDTKADGTKKTPEEIANDLATLRQNIEFHGIEMNKFTMKYLAATKEGMKVLAEQPGGTDYIRDAMRRGEMKDFANFPPEVKAKIQEETTKAIKDKVDKSKKTVDDKITKLQTEITEAEARGEDTENANIKLENLKKLSKAYEALDFSDPAKLQKLYEKLEQHQPPVGFSDMPKLADVFFANAEGMNPDYIANILDGKVKYDKGEGPGGKGKLMYVEGRILGVGGLGEAWSTMTFEAGSAAGKEMVFKKSKSNIDLSPGVSPDSVLSHSFDFYDTLDPGEKAKLHDVFAKFRSQGVNEPHGLEDAQQAVAAIFGHSSRENVTIRDYLTRMQAIADEASNASLIMRHQANGKLLGFTRMNYVTEGGVVFQESIANPNANYAVCDYDKIMSGEVSSLDGKTPISKENFWGGMTDVMDALADANELGIVHRDIKPENFGIGPDGKIRLIDVGSVRTKDQIGHLDFFEVPKIGPMVDLYTIPQNVGKATMHLPNRGGITAWFYNDTISYHEAKGTLGPDNKPIVSFGGSDRFAMAMSLQDVVDNHGDPSKPKWASDTQIAELVNVIQYLKGPRSDMRVAAERVRQIMGVNP